MPSPFSAVGVAGMVNDIDNLMWRDASFKPDNARGTWRLGLLSVLLLIANSVIAAAAIWGDAADITGVENAVAHTTSRLALGHPLYLDPESPPFSLVQYTPLHYQMSTAVVRLTELDPRDPATITRVGRAVAAAMWITALAVVGLWLLRLGTGLAVGVALLAWWTTQSGVWWFLNRPDSAETMLLFVALATTARSVRPEKVSLAWLVTASLAGVAVGYAKQNGWLASVILIAFLIVAGRRRHAFLAFAATLLGHGLMHGTALSVWGDAWPRNIIGALDNGIRLDRAILLAYQPIAYQAAAVLAVAFVISWRWRRLAGDPRQLLLTAFAIAFVSAVIAALKIGSADNYFIDACGVAVLILGAGLAELRRSNPDALPLVMAATTIFLALLAPIKLYESWRRVSNVRSYASLRPAVERIERLLADRPDAWVFAEDGRLAHFFPERSCLPQLLLAQLAFERKTFAFRSLPEFFKHGEVAVAVLRLPPNVKREPPLRILGGSLEGFMLVGEVDGALIYLHQRYGSKAVP
jgi:hypothetical protein